MKTLFEKYSRTFMRHHPDINIPGSPERCISRFVAEDTTGTVWLVEQLKSTQKDWRSVVGELLVCLHQENTLHVHAPATTKNNETVILHEGHPYQITPFIIGTDLPRPEYCADTERGRAIGNFILSLQAAGENIPIPENSTPPLPEYIEDIVGTIKQHRPEMMPRIERVLQHLETFFTEERSIPAALAHGDCHPLNIIWNENEIAGVIDWEFTGKKIALYDAANCIGCVGMEHPNWLINGLVPELVTTIRAGSSIIDAHIHQLIPVIIALRFAWLSEWLRKKDTEMQEQELDYMLLLATSQKEIEGFWERHYSHSIQSHM